MSIRLFKKLGRSPLRLRSIAKLKLMRTAALTLSKLNSHLKQKGLPGLKSLGQLKSLDGSPLKSLSQPLRSPFQRRQPPPSLESLGLDRSGVNSPENPDLQTTDDSSEGPPDQDQESE